MDLPWLFSVQVLAIVQAPYSSDFALVFLLLVQNSEITAPLKNAEGTDPVSNFLAEYSKKTKRKKKKKKKKKTTEITIIHLILFIHECPFGCKYIIIQCSVNEFHIIE